MSMSTTAVEVLMCMEEGRLRLSRAMEAADILYFRPMFSLLSQRVFPQRPITDDMRQMLDDLGIDWPEFQPISFDGATFRWR